MLNDGSNWVNASKTVIIEKARKIYEAFLAPSKKRIANGADTHQPLELDAASHCRPAGRTRSRASGTGDCYRTLCGACTANGADAECRTANLPVGLAVALPPPVITAAAPISSTTAAAATETNVAAAIGALVGAMKHFKETAVKSNNPATFKPVAVVVAWTRFLEDAAASSGK